jgi:hypothetical protein
MARIPEDPIALRMARSFAPDWGNASEESRALYLRHAYLALAKMIPPTAAMVKAGVENMNIAGFDDQRRVTRIFQAMVEAALREKA